MNTLYLTAQEQALYEALSAELKEGWQTAEEPLTYTDTPQKQLVRLSLVRLHDPKLLKLRDKSMNLATIEDVVQLIQGSNLKDVSEDDLAELFFALGPSVITRLIAHMLKTAQNDKDVEGATALSVIRHSILAAFDKVS